MVREVQPQCDLGSYTRTAGGALSRCLAPTRADNQGSIAGSTRVSWEELHMPVTVKQITLWRTEVENRAGVLAQTLKPLAEAGADLHLVMGYRYPGDESKAAIEVYPIAGKKVVAAAQAT